MSNLVIEILLRLAKAGIAALLGVVLYALLVGPLGATGTDFTSPAGMRVLCPTNEVFQLLPPSSEKSSS